MSRFRPSWGWLVLMAVPACGPDAPSAPPAAFPHAGITPSCGPADGPAVEIYLTADSVTTIEPPVPFVHLYVGEALQELEGRDVRLAGADAAGSAAYCDTTGCEPADLATLAVTDVIADYTTVGSVDLRFPKAGRISGGFRAVWVPREVLCG